LLQTLFLILATLAVLAALGTVLARNLVHAALHLVAFFFLIACQFVVLEAEFLAAVQVLVYIGAVAILMMFGIMLTRNIQGDESSVSRSSRVPAALASLGFLAVLAYGIGGSQEWNRAEVRPAIGPDEALATSPKAKAVNNMGKVLGDELMGRYALPFEVAGLLLTAALVGSIALAIQDRDDDEPADRAKVARNGRKARTAEAPAASPTP
jgi:NADH-quinone oxidoreductase subunit J